MKRLIQTLFFFFSWISSSVTFSAPNIIVHNRISTFQRTEKIIHVEKSKIGVHPESFRDARSSIEESKIQTTTFHQNTFSLSTYLEAENSCVLDIQKTISPDKIAEDFQGNTYQKAYMAGKYTTAILSVLLPSTVSFP